MSLRGEGFFLHMRRGFGIVFLIYDQISHHHHQYQMRLAKKVNINYRKTRLDRSENLLEHTIKYTKHQQYIPLG